MPIFINHSPVAAIADLATKAGKEDQARYQDQQRLQQQQMQTQQQAGQEAQRFRNVQEMRMTRQLEHQMETQQAQQDLREREFTFQQKIETARAKGNEKRAQELETQASQAAQQEMQAAEARRAQRDAVIGTIREKSPDIPREALELMTDAALASFATRIAGMDPANPEHASQAAEIARGLAETQRKVEVDRLQAEIAEDRRVLGSLTEGKYGDAMLLSDEALRSRFADAAEPIILRRRAAQGRVKKLSDVQRDESLRNTTGQIMDVTAFDATVQGRTFERIMETVLEKASEKGEQVTAPKIQRRLRELGWAELEPDTLAEAVAFAQEQQQAAMEAEQGQQEGEGGEGMPAGEKKPGVLRQAAGWAWRNHPPNWLMNQAIGSASPRPLDPSKVAGTAPTTIQDPSSVRGGATPEGAMIVAPAEPSGGMIAAADQKAEQPTRSTQDSVREAFRLRREGNDDEATALFRQAAETGDPRGMRALGAVLYDDGEHEEGVAWMMKAIEAGDTDAMVDFGARRPIGEDESADPRARRVADDAHARKWYTKAAEKGNTDAMKMLGQLSQNETLPAYTRRNDKEAYGWYRKAAEAGDADAMEKVGVFHERGEGGVAKDPEEARRWYLRSIEAGNRKWGERRLKGMERRLADEAEREKETE